MNGYDLSVLRAEFGDLLYFFEELDSTNERSLLLLSLIHI